MDHCSHRNGDDGFNSIVLHSIYYVEHRIYNNSKSTDFENQASNLGFTAIQDLDQKQAKGIVQNIYSLAVRFIKLYAKEFDVECEIKICSFS